jgi:L-lactate dehydrogenase complex protein LldG
VSEHGDRERFIGTLRARLAAGAPTPTRALIERGPVPVAISRPPAGVDPEDLVGWFCTAATAVLATVHRPFTDEVLAEIVERHRIRRAVVTTEPVAQQVGDRLRSLGIDVNALSIAAAERADLGVTGATAAIAATGSLVVEADVAGGRTASLLPPVHLAVVSESAIVARTADVLRRLGTPGRLPSNLTLITGPSRSADIEQIIAMGVHGPVAVEIGLVSGG